VVAFITAEELLSIKRAIPDATSTSVASGFRATIWIWVLGPILIQVLLGMRNSDLAFSPE
jgi:hypothetical protein